MRQHGVSAICDIAYAAGEMMLPWIADNLRVPASWPTALALCAAWLVLMLGYSPLADLIATCFVRKPPTLGAFRRLQESRAKLMAGVVVAWILGGFLEEMLLRGIVLQSVERAVAGYFGGAVAAGMGVCAAALLAALLHAYQGRRAMLIIAQLSVLFGVLFIVGGRNLWPVILCHGVYDTIAFIRFAKGRSKYSRLGHAPRTAESTAPSEQAT